MALLLLSLNAEGFMHSQNNCSEDGGICPTQTARGALATVVHQHTADSTRQAALGTARGYTGISTGISTLAWTTQGGIGHPVLAPCFT